MSSDDKVDEAAAVQCEHELRAWLKTLPVMYEVRTMTQMAWDTAWDKALAAGRAQGRAEGREEQRKADLGAVDELRLECDGDHQGSDHDECYACCRREFALMLVKQITEAEEPSK